MYLKFRNKLTGVSQKASFPGIWVVHLSTWKPSDDNKSFLFTRKRKLRYLACKKSINLKSRNITRNDNNIYLLLLGHCYLIHLSPLKKRFRRFFRLFVPPWRWLWLPVALDCTGACSESSCVLRSLKLLQYTFWGGSMSDARCARISEGGRPALLILCEWRYSIAFNLSWYWSNLRSSSSWRTWLLSWL